MIGQMVKGKKMRKKTKYENDEKTTFETNSG